MPASAHLMEPKVEMLLQLHDEEAILETVFPKKIICLHIEIR